MPPDAVWARRKEAVSRALALAPSDTVRSLGHAFQEALAAYEAEAREVGSSFVEIQNTMLFATVGQKTE
jgi:hypothetical protein